jgi:hypothetical protein
LGVAPVVNVLVIAISSRRLSGGKTFSEWYHVSAYILHHSCGDISDIFIPGHGAIDSKHGPENVCTGIPIDWQYPEVD